MNCPICGKQAPPGAKLCGPCRAALKRARDDSILEIPGTLAASRDAAPDSAPPAPAAAAPSAARWVLGSGRLAGWRGVTAAAALVAIGVAGGTLITHGGEAAKAPDVAAVPEPALQPMPPLVVESKPATEMPVAQFTPPREVVQPPRHDPPHPPKPARAAPEAPPPAPAPQPEPVVEAPRPAPPPVREAPRPVDPWQRMSEALARCANEDLFGRIRCEYRVRTTYCDGHWGEVPQCPGAPVNDHGQ
jgi:hypothetical protein